MDLRPVVLAVECHADTLDMLSRFLSMLGYGCRTASTVEDAERELGRGGLSAVILEPEMHGRPVGEFLGRIAPLLAPPPLILVSAQSPVALDDSARRLRPEAVFPKPCDLDSLAIALGKAVGAVGTTGTAETAGPRMVRTRFPAGSHSVPPPRFPGRA
jgi:DNA-binding NtrC family response regulator